MTYFAITAQYPVFTELNGTPLENGYIYIGEAGKNPVTNPITAYWDDGLLYPAAQPIRTLAGAPNRGGSPSAIFCNSEFSILVNDKNGNQVYYSATGIKNYTAATLEDRKNYIMNGKFNIIQRGITNNPDRWQLADSGYTGSQTTYTFTLSDSTIPTNPTAYQVLDYAGSSALVTDYVKYYEVIEDVSTFSGKDIILSFYAKSGTDGRSEFSTSFDLLKSSSYTSTAYYAQGIGVTKHELTGDWTQYSVILSVPPIANTGGESIPNFVDSGLVVNFWLAAGTDYDDQTNELGRAAGELHITDVRINLGTQIITGNDRTFNEELALCQRYYEKSYNYADIPGANTLTGSIFLTAANADEFLPTHPFLVKKRINPVVTLWSPSAADQIDEVLHIGTGDVAVVSTDASEANINTIEIGVAKTDTENYRYHYAADAEFVL